MSWNPDCSSTTSAFLDATRQAFFEAHELGFAFFCGVFRTPGPWSGFSLEPAGALRSVNPVWSSDITYIRMAGGFVYLVAGRDCKRLANPR